jgi:hypothetical protein
MAKTATPGRPTARLSAALTRQDWVAVGIELLVVVIGVLVALEVNQWEQKRETRSLEHAYLLRLKEDLQMERDAADRFNSIVTDRLSAIALLDRIAKDPATNVRDARMIPWAVETASWGSFPPIHNISYNELQSTGRTGLIRSVKLRRALAEHYATLADLAVPAQDRTGEERFDSDTAGLLSIDESMAVESADGDYHRMPPIGADRAALIEAAFAKRHLAVRELPDLAEHHVFDRRIIEGMRFRINALIALINRQLGGAEGRSSSAQQ